MNAPIIARQATTPAAKVLQQFPEPKDYGKLPDYRIPTWGRSYLRAVRDPVAGVFNAEMIAFQLAQKGFLPPKV